ncbi:MAG TPA: hypothetical protein VEX86_24500 [Longimicrobium sp.]|nr:hypothetical protein [Longimicrobium sp.]
MTLDYAPPVSKLLEFGYLRRPPASYVRLLRLAPEHVPELLRLAGDPRLLGDEVVDGLDSSAYFGPLHAWRALAELRPPGAAEALVELYHAYPYDEDVLDELPECVAAIGPDVAPLLIRAASDGGWTTDSRSVAVRTMEVLARRHPETREELRAPLGSLFDGYVDNDPELNAALVYGLVATGAVEHRPAIEAALALGHISREHWDWDWLEDEFGVVLPPELPRKPAEIVIIPPRHSGAAAAPKRDSSATARRKRMQKAARRKNRRRR